MTHLTVESGSDKKAAIKRDLKACGIYATRVVQEGYCHYRITFECPEDLLLYKMLGKLTTKDTWRRNRKGDVIPAPKVYMFWG